MAGLRLPPCVWPSRSVVEISSLLRDKSSIHHIGGEMLPADNELMRLCLPLLRFPDSATLQSALHASKSGGWADGVEGTACIWYLRQADTTLVVTSAHALLVGDQLMHLPPPERQACHGYLYLALADAQWLTGKPDIAEQHLAVARECFDGIVDCPGASDADWIAANFAHDVGKIEDRQRLMRESLCAAENLGDKDREASCMIALACFDTFAEMRNAWQGKVVPYTDSPTPSLRAFASQFMFMVSLSEGAHHHAIKYAVASQRASEECGLLRRAIFAACNVALSFTDLGDLSSALTWLETALEKARACGWPHPLGYCLTAMSSALLKAGRNQEALETAEEAGIVLAGFARTTGYIGALSSIGDAALACGNVVLARESYTTISLPNCPSEYPKARHYGILGLARIAERTGDLDEARHLCIQVLELPAEIPDYALDVAAMLLLSKVIERLDASSISESPLQALIDHTPSMYMNRYSNGRDPANTRTDPIQILDDAISLADERLDGAGRQVLLLEKAGMLEKRGSSEQALAAMKAALNSAVAEKARSVSRLSLSLEVRFKTEALLEAKFHQHAAAAETARAAELVSLNLQLQTAVTSLKEAQELLVHRNAELSSANAQITDLSVTDPLTGMRNRRFLSQVIDTAVAESLRSYSEANGGRKDIVFFLLDIDHFKRVNDEYGHASGDAILVQLRDRLRMVTRDQDFLVRWGGEEFLVAVCGIDRAEAPLIAERLCLSVSSSMFEIGKGHMISKTVSIGFASFPVDSSNPTAAGWEQAVELADARLYCAKRAGRDQWVGDVAVPSSSTPNASGLIDDM